MPDDLERFLDAQSEAWPQVLSELKAGRKESHWMWFTFPQLAGLGRSPTAVRFGIAGAGEAKAYLQNPVLGARLRECTEMVNAIPDRPIADIFSYPDDLKFRSCMTLFSAVAHDDEVFNLALSKYFKGEPDAATVALLLEEAPLSHEFELAADAIVTGDLPALRALLARRPELVRARSIREHSSTLLHYVSANGIEGRRQKTPPNIVEIATLLLDAGSDVNAESEAYGGHSTALNLTATSCHPEAAGVQLELLQLLLDRGAAIDIPGGANTVNACLHNGRGLAATFLSGRGAVTDLEGAAGVGRLDLVQSCFDRDGILQPPATQSQLHAAFAWACQFGHTDIVAFLLQRGVPPGASFQHRQTGLHWAAWGGHPAIARLLLDSGAPVDLADENFGSTPLEWSLFAWANDTGNRAWPEVVSMLIGAGAALDSHWFESHPSRLRVAEKLKSDLRMQAALRGEAV